MQVDFNTMDKAELRAYVIKHPNDKIAFQTFVDRYTAAAPSILYSMAKSPEEVKEVDTLIQQKLNKAKSN